MKCGTTALASFLAAHPEACLAEGKEAHFFDVDENFPPGTEPDWGLYHARFRPGPEARLLVDATPVYLYWERSAERIQAYNPDMKWVILLRQPAERAYSHWNAYRAAGLEPLELEEALAAEAARRAALPHQDRIGSYLDRGFYARQLRRLFQAVPPDQVLVLRTEELLHDHERCLERVASFAGVTPGLMPPPRVVHSTPHAAPLAPEVRRRLTEKYLDDIADLERLLGWDLSEWRAPQGGRLTTK
jgi:hypothetical protein